jgi:hypothetical protein
MLDFSTAQAEITAQSVIANAAEIHGVLTGLVSGGLAFENTEYLVIINDLFNNGEGLPASVKSTIKQMYSDIWQNLQDDNYGFQLLLPDDDESLSERTAATSAWVQGFNLGLGLQMKNTGNIASSSLSSDVQEVLKDFAEIANLSQEVDEDEASEQAYFEIVEYVRLSALMCFSELGCIPESKPKQTPLH